MTRMRGMGASFELWIGMGCLRLLRLYWVGLERGLTRRKMAMILYYHQSASNDSIDREKQKRNGTYRSKRGKYSPPKHIAVSTPTTLDLSSIGHLPFVREHWIVDVVNAGCEQRHAVSFLRVCI